MQDSPDLSSIVQADPSLTDQQKDKIRQVLESRQGKSRLFSGALGAGLVVAAGKYYKLSTAAKTILGLAGFGVGKLVYDLLTKQDRQFSKYNDKMRAYEMDTRRY